MKHPAKPPELGTPPPRYIRLQQQLAHTGWICQGTLVCRPLIRTVNGKTVKRGPYYLWTTKIHGKTRCVALSADQYRLIQKAINNNCLLLKTIEQMQSMTFDTVLKTVPGVKKRK